MAKSNLLFSRSIVSIDCQIIGLNCLHFVVTNRRRNSLRIGVASNVRMRQQINWMPTFFWITLYFWTNKQNIQSVNSSRIFPRKKWKIRNNKCSLEDMLQQNHSVQQTIRLDFATLVVLCSVVVIDLVRGIWILNFFKKKIKREKKRKENYLRNQEHCTNWIDVAIWLFITKGGGWGDQLETFLYSEKREREKKLKMWTQLMFYRSSVKKNDDRDAKCPNINFCVVSTHWE